jgi:hypothetical protein
MRIIRQLGIWTAIIALVLQLGCGGSSTSDPSGSTAETSAAETSGRAVPTMPAARFAQPTTMITVADSTGVTGTDTITNSDAITGTDAITDSETMTVPETVETPVPAADAADLERGERAYVRHCVECHGEQGTGVADKGPALTDLALSQDEFVDLLRTGGGLGPEHLFGPQKISPGSIDALYMYVLTLAESE